MSTRHLKSNFIEKTLFLCFFFLLGTANLIGAEGGGVNIGAYPKNNNFTCANATAEIIFCDDFEDSDIEARYEYVNTNGLSVTSNDAFSGVSSLEMQYDTGQEDAGWVGKVDSDGFPEHVFMKWDHKFEAGFDGFPPKMARMRYRDRDSWDRIFAVHAWIDDGYVVADVLASNSSQANQSGYLPKAVSDFSFNDPANIGVWVCFEMEVLLNTPGRQDGAYRIWANNDLIIERVSVDLRGNTTDKMNEIMLDNYWNGGSPKAQSRFYDDFIISTNPIGCNPTLPTNDEILTINTAGNGTVEQSPLPNNGTYNNGETVTLTARPDAGWQFTGWSGGLLGTVNPENIIMDGDKTLIANFGQIPSEDVISPAITNVDITITGNIPNATALTSGSATGVVQSNGDFTITVPEGITQITLSATRESQTSTIDINIDADFSTSITTQ